MMGGLLHNLIVIAPTGLATVCLLRGDGLNALSANVASGMVGSRSKMLGAEDRPAIAAPQGTSVLKSHAEFLSEAGPIACLCIWSSTPSAGDATLMQGFYESLHYATITPCQH